MTHFGVICPPVSGHLNPMTALGYELKLRGHQVTFVQISDAQEKVQAAGLDFFPIGQKTLPAGSLAENVKQLGKLKTLAALRFTTKLIQQMTNIICSEAPNAIQSLGIEVLLVDQQELAGGSVAEFVNIPFITICNSLATNRSPGVPPAITSWKYRTDWYGIVRNHIAFYFFDHIVPPPSQIVVREYRRQWGLSAYQKRDDAFSQLAQISQQPAAFDFPRTVLPDCFHYVGPLQNPSLTSVPFPFEKLTGQPLIYASLGTLQNLNPKIFYYIAAACQGLDAQLVISLGGGSSVEALPQLPGNPLVVNYAPQLQLLTRARLTITHAGLNTTLESLNNGVPLVAIPITNDQPAVAARIAWTGSGEFMSLSRLNIPRLRAMIQRVLSEPSYLIHAQRLQESIRQSGGVARAANIIEQVCA